MSLVTLSHGVYSPEQIHGLLANRDTVSEEMLVAGRMHVARRHGFLVASAGWEPRDRNGQPSAHVRSVFVHPLQVRQGLASRLVRAVEADAQRHGFGRFTLAATLNAVTLYERLGYAAIGPGRIGLGGTLAFPVVRMERRVTAAPLSQSSMLINAED